MLAAEVLKMITAARHNVESDATADEIDQACLYLADSSRQRVNLREWCRLYGHRYEQFRKALFSVGEPPGSIAFAAVWSAPVPVDGQRAIHRRRGRSPGLRQPL